jgi:hypothetical protein
MKYKNVFKTVTKKSSRIEFTDIIKQAVLNPNIDGLVLNMNGGWDWIDLKYGFIQLLLKRGQIKAIKSGSDLLACDTYLEALTSGSFVNVVLEARPSAKHQANASEKRILKAREKLYKHMLNFRLEAPVSWMIEQNQNETKGA